MSIPLDRLYEFVETTFQDVCNDDVVIYRFWPHGSKNVKDLVRMRTYTWLEMLISYPMICHDQEPLDFDRNVNNSDHIYNTQNQYYRMLVNHGLKPRKFNLRWAVNIYDKCVLLHSEQRSENVEKYRANDYVPAYYWSHAVIAGDWFRYAQHRSLKKQVIQPFLIYNRAWSGTREYRIKFAEMLLKKNLVTHCRTWFNPRDCETNQHYQEHAYKNPVWQPTVSLDHVFEPTQATASYSADIDFKDYEATAIEVVLETLFDDARLHLTEKILRPIACGQPFILAATHGSLKYLRDYGFQTFDTVWDERYDLIEDPEQRMNCIGELMKEISAWSTSVREQKLIQAQRIADHNRQHFFSPDFFNQVVAELTNNLSTAWNEIETTNAAEKFFVTRRRLASVPEIRQVLSNVVDHPDKNNKFYKNFNRQNILRVVKKARQYYLRSLHDK